MGTELFAIIISIPVLIAIDKSEIKLAFTRFAIILTPILVMVAGVEINHGRWLIYIIAALTMLLSSNKKNNDKNESE